MDGGRLDRRRESALAPPPASGQTLPAAPAAPVAASPTSARGLDWFTFFLADIQTGFGPFVAIYLTAHEWAQFDIGLVLTAGGLVALAGQMPAGALVDAVRSARLVGALAVGAGWLLRSGESEGSGVPTSGASARGSGRTATAAGADEGATRARLDESVASTSSGLPPCEPGPPDGLLVRAVAADGGPVAGAQIYVVPESNANSRALFEDLLPFLEEPRRLSTAHARGYLADSKGEVHVVRPAFDAFLLGFAGDLRGAARLLEPARAELELRFERASDLGVLVVDASEAPVRDARVAFASRSVPDPALDPRNDYRPPLNQHHEGVTTDERGLARLIGTDIARVRHVQIERFGKFAFCVAVPYLGAENHRGAKTQFGATDVGDAGELASLRGPVRVRLEEPFGGIEVRLVDRGLALDGEVIVDSYVGATYAAELTDGERVQRRPLEKGVARFFPVALGQHFDVSARLSGGGTLKKTVDGPRAAGDVVRVDLDPQRDRRIVRGRLVGLPAPHGPIPRMTGELVQAPPLPETSKKVPSVRVAAPLPLLVPVETDAHDDGSFEIDVTSISSRRFLSLQLRAFDREHLQGFVANASLPDELVDPVTDLGDVAVVAIPVLGWGRVIDDLRRPLAGVTVTLSNADAQWGRWIGTRTTSEGDGSFALVGTVSQPDVKLYFVPPPGFASAVEELPRDDRELEVVLPRTGRIAGSVMADFTITLVAAARAPSPGASSLSPPIGAREFSKLRDGNGTAVAWPFTFELRPGRYDLLVTTTPERPRMGVVAWIDDLEVRPTEVTTDARLSPLVVGRGQKTWRIHLARSDGAPPPPAWVRVSPVDAPTEPWRTELVAAGEASFESALESAWIDVDAVSFRRVHQLYPRGDVSIVLEPLEQRDVEIALDAGDAPHCYDLHWIVAADSSRPQPGFLRDNYSTTVVPGGTSRLSLDEGERWKLRLFAQIDAGGAPRRVELTRCMQEVSTRGDASETPARLSFTVHADEVDALWQELSKSE
jgi:hypothetical protein